MSIIITVIIISAISPVTTIVIILPVSTSIITTGIFIITIIINVLVPNPHHNSEA